MPRVLFTANLQRHVPCPELAVEGSTVRAVLDAYFAVHPRVRGYVLDEQGTLRQHMAIFIGDQPAYDRQWLSDTVPPNADLFVFQALSGG